MVSFKKIIVGDSSKAIADTLAAEDERMTVVQWIVLGWMHWINVMHKESFEPVDLAMEAQVDLEASVYLALSGFIKQANQVLRSWLELVLLSLWFNLNFNEKQYEAWLLAQPKAPFNKIFRRTTLGRILSKTPELEKAEKHHHLANRMLTLYGHLSVFTHALGLQAFEMFGRKKKKSCDIQLQKNFQKWYSLLWESYSAVSSILFLRLCQTFTKDSVGIAPGQQQWDALVNGMKGSDLEMLESMIGQSK